MKKRKINIDFVRKAVVLVIAAVFIASTFSTVIGINNLRISMNTSTDSSKNKLVFINNIIDKLKTGIKKSENIQLKDINQNPFPLNIEDSWWDIDWQYRKEITINHSKVDGDLNNFPILISSESDSDLSSYAQASGYDIAFTDKTGNQLNHEIELFNSGTGQLIAWVNVNSIYGSVNTTLYMYYGNSAAANQQNPSNVWDSNYIMVQHLNETGNTYNDSTSNDNDGANTGTVFNQDCKIDGGRQYDDDDYITVNGFTHTPTALTAEAWIYRDATSYINIFCDGTHFNTCDWILYLRTASSTEGIDFGINNHGSYIRRANTPANTWFYLTATYDAGDVVLYVNGSQVGSGTIATSINSNYADLGLGNDNAGGQPWADGKLDEIRVSNIARNSNWIGTSYNTSSDPDSFFTLGTQEEFPGIPDEPVISNPSPVNGSTDAVPLSLSKLSFDLNDYQSDLMNYEVETSPDIGSGSDTGVGNGTYNISVSGLSYNTLYTWYVNATDPKPGGSGNWTNVTYQFTTIAYETTPPSIDLLDFAGNPDDSGGPHYLPGTSTAAPDGYYTNDSHQEEDWILIQCTVTDDAGVLEVWLQWLNETSWTNDTYQLTNTGGDSYEINMSADITSDYKYSFDILAKDTSGNTAIYQWMKAGDDTTTVDDRRYIQLAGTSTNISFTPYYFYPADYSYTTGYGSGHNPSNDDPLHHDQGPDGTLTDTGYMLAQLPSDTMQIRYCGRYVGFWFDETVTAQSGTLNNIYHHFWWNTTGDEITVAYGKWDGGFYRTDNWDESYLINYTEAHSNVTYGGRTYHLESRLMDITTPQSYTDNDVYEFFVEYDTIPSTNPWVIDNRSILSYVIFNVPDNTTLQGQDSDNDGLTDYNELYITYTSPFLSDTDNDGVTDYIESLSGSDPNDYQDTQHASPILSSESPAHKSTAQSLNPTLSITVNDAQEDMMNITFRTNASGSWQNIGNNESIYNGTYSQTPSNMDSYETTYFWSVNASDGILWTNATYYFTTSSEPVPWWDEDWQYSKKITIDHTKVDDDLTNFPILIQNTSSDFISHAQSDGDDFVFVSGDNTTVYNHEIEKYNSTDGELIAWVNITTVSSTVDTVLYLYYGNTGASNQQNPSGVWDSNYVMVQHLNETGNTVNDSTIYGNNGNNSGTSFLQNSRIDGGRQYDYADYIQVSDFTDTPNTLTAEAWMYRDSTSFIYTFCKGTYSTSSDWILYLRTAYPTAGIDFGINNHASYRREGTTPVNTWFYIAATYDSSSRTATVYVNDSVQLSGTLSGSQSTINDNFPHLGLGDDYTGTNGGENPMTDVRFDEMRISKIVRSSDWITTSFNTMSSPSTFLQMGSEIEKGEGDTIPPEITNITATPKRSEINEYINITCDVTDNVGLSVVNVSITGPVGFDPINTSMTDGSSYYYNQTYSIPGIYTYYIWAKDTSGNTDTSSLYQFSIIRWYVVLNISTTSGKFDTVVFGEVDDASDAQDQYDVPKPPAPNEPYVYAYFDAGLSEPYDKLWEEYKDYPDNTETWDLYVKCNTSGPILGDTDVTLSWDTDEVNDSEYDIVELWNATEKIADMRTENKYTFDADFDEEYNFLIKCIYTHDLTVDSSSGGSVVTPGEGTFTYDYGSVVDLAAEADVGYYFVEWTGDNGTIGD